MCCILNVQNVCLVCVFLEIFVFFCLLNSRWSYFLFVVVVQNFLLFNEITIGCLFVKPLKKSLTRSLLFTEKRKRKSKSNLTHFKFYFNVIIIYLYEITEPFFVLCNVNVCIPLLWHLIHHCTGHFFFLPHTRLQERANF